MRMLYIYIYIHTSLSIYMYIYICIFLSLFMYIYIYIYTHTYACVVFIDACRQDPSAFGDGYDELLVRSSRRYKAQRTTLRHAS